MEFLIHCPINRLSIGQVSYNILREAYKNKDNIYVLPIGNQADVAVYKKDDDFNIWLSGRIDKTLKSYKRDIPCLKIWHINGSLESAAQKQVLYTFHELDQATEQEINIVNNQHATVFCSKYSKEVFDLFGAERAFHAPLGFDSIHFKELNLPKDTNVVQWSLCGKLEPVRKRHAKIIQGWCKKFGNNPLHRLNLAVTNPFLNQDQHNSLFAQIFNGNNKPWNVNILNYFETNEAYNQFLNYMNIDLTGLAGAEGWNLPAFTMSALGKWSVVLNATGHKDWATKENSILVEPDGKIPCYDGMFFAEHQPFNQGNIYDFSDEKLLHALDTALYTYAQKPMNEEGKKLQNFTYGNLYNYLVAQLFS